MNIVLWKKACLAAALTLCASCLILLGGCGRSYLQETSRQAASSASDTSSETLARDGSESTSAAEAIGASSEGTASKGAASGNKDTEASGTSDPAEEEGIYVQVTGAVLEPGVYYLKKDARAFEAVDMAGGLTEDADAESVNQAARLTDGQMLHIYRIGETPQDVTGAAEENGASDTGLVNINTADAAELMTLPGIGETRAAAIIAYRDSDGPFQTCEDIMQVSGIKEGAYSKFKDLITVN